LSQKARQKRYCETEFFFLLPVTEFWTIKPAVSLYPDPSQFIHLGKDSNTRPSATNYLWKLLSWSVFLNDGKSRHLS